MLKGKRIGRRGASFNRARIKDIRINLPFRQRRPEPAAQRPFGWQHIQPCALETMTVQVARDGGSFARLQ
jgi:hypothetical protein